MLVATSPIRIMARGRTRPTRRALRIDSSTWLKAVAAKNSENGIGAIPFITCST